MNSQVGVVLDIIGEVDIDNQGVCAYDAKNLSNYTVTNQLWTFGNDRLTTKVHLGVLYTYGRRGRGGSYRSVELVSLLILARSK